MSARRAAPGFGLALLLAGCGGTAPVHELRGPTMGSSFDVKWHGGPDPVAARAAIEEVLAEHDRCFSLWREDSEISALNRCRAVGPQPLTPLFAAVLERALQVAARTDGAFDPTVRPLSALYQRKKRGEPVTDADLAAAAARVGWRGLRLTEEGLQKQPPDLELDLDGIVAGAAAEALRLRLRRLGALGGMLDITGEVLCFGVKPDGSPWRIGIESPEAVEQGSAMVTTLPLRDQALCTSGSYRNFIEQGGKLANHVFDPRSGQSVHNGVVSVSVLAASCALADALGTALMVLGPKAGAACLQGWRGEGTMGALFVLQDPDGALRVQRLHWPDPE